MAFLKHFYGRQVLPWYKQAVQNVSDCLASVSHAATPLHMNVISSLHWYASILRRWICDGFVKVLCRVRTSSHQFAPIPIAALTTVSALSAVGTVGTVGWLSQGDPWERGRLDRAQVSTTN